MKILVAMSGGVDSAVTAFLLKEKGYEVVGVHFKLGSSSTRYKSAQKACCNQNDMSDVKRIAKKLNIELRIVDLHQEFEKEIIHDFIKGYELGVTPNPCVKCNRKIKFFYLAKYANAIGASLWATGHYARIDEDGILVAKDTKKDQSYFLALVQKELLKGLILPMGEYSNKDDVRKIAEKNDLIVSSKPDSQDVCFIPDGNIKSFFESRKIAVKKGPVLNTNGETIGWHNGYQLYTLGQRRGLGIATGSRVYVVDIIPSKNAIVVGERGKLYKKEAMVMQMNFFKKMPDKFDCECKVRSTAKKVPCHVKIFENGKKSIVEFSREVLPVPGQLLAFYDGDRLLGGGIMVKSFEKDTLS